MGKVIIGMTGATIALVMIAFIATLGGTMVWLVWPTAVMAFPTAVTNGYLAAEISWSTSICLSFLCGLLIKSSLTESSE